jgi:hypothetical protein
MGTNALFQAAAYPEAIAAATYVGRKSSTSPWPG